MKWEDNIKETLEKRTIKPSDTAWNTLAHRLDAADKKKGKVLYWWMGVAASVVALLFTAAIFFNSTPEIQTPVLVDTQKQVDDQLILMEQSPIKEHVAEIQQNNETLELLQKNSPKNELVKKQIDFKTSEKQNSTVTKSEKESAVEPLQINLQKDILEDKKVTEIVAQINDLKSKGQTVTDTDIEVLLHQAQKEIAYHTILKEGMKTVDANALLQDVESDLQQSFRNKIFEALKNSYETVKTAVAERKN